MLLELYFVSGILLFAVIALAMAAEHRFAGHFFHRESISLRLSRRFEQAHPDLCDSRDSFYTFFRRDRLHTK